MLFSRETYLEGMVGTLNLEQLSIMKEPTHHEAEEEIKKSEEAHIKLMTDLQHRLLQHGEASLPLLEKPLLRKALQRRSR